VAGSCEYGDEPSGSGATELVFRETIVTPRCRAYVTIAGERTRAQLCCLCEFNKNNTHSVLFFNRYDI
jgi:hypothetical protein